MSGKKYKVSQIVDGKKYVYGNFHANNTRMAVMKAVEKSNGIVPMNTDNDFDIKYGLNEFSFNLKEGE